MFLMIRSQMSTYAEHNFSLLSTSFDFWQISNDFWELSYWFSLVAPAILMVEWFFSLTTIMASTPFHAWSCPNNVSWTHFPSSKFKCLSEACCTRVALNRPWPSWRRNWSKAHDMGNVPIIFFTKRRLSTTSIESYPSCFCTLKIVLFHTLLTCFAP